MNQLALTTPNDIALSEHAAVIRALGKRVAHGGWLPWLDRELGWSKDTALNFMNVYRFETQLQERKIPNCSGFGPGCAAFIFSPRPGRRMRPAMRSIDRLKNGEDLTHAEVKAMIDEARKIMRMREDYDLAARSNQPAIDRSSRSIHSERRNRGGGMSEHNARVRTAMMSASDLLVSISIYNPRLQRISL